MPDDESRCHHQCQRRHEEPAIATTGNWQRWSVSYSAYPARNDEKLIFWMYYDGMASGAPGSFNVYIDDFEIFCDNPADPWP